MMAAAVLKEGTQNEGDAGTSGLAGTAVECGSMRQQQDEHGSSTCTLPLPPPPRPQGNHAGSCSGSEADPAATSDARLLPGSEQQKKEQKQPIGQKQKQQRQHKQQQKQLQHSQHHQQQPPLLNAQQLRQHQHPQHFLHHQHLPHAAQLHQLQNMHQLGPLGQRPQHPPYPQHPEHYHQAPSQQFEQHHYHQQLQQRRQHHLEQQRLAHPTWQHAMQQFPPDRLLHTQPPQPLPAHALNLQNKVPVEIAPLPGHPRYQGLAPEAAAHALPDRQPEQQPPQQLPKHKQQLDHLQRLLAPMASLPEESVEEKQPQEQQPQKQQRSATIPAPPPLPASGRDASARKPQDVSAREQFHQPQRQQQQQCQSGSSAGPPVGAPPHRVPPPPPPPPAPPIGAHPGRAEPAGTGNSRRENSKERAKASVELLRQLGRSLPADQQPGEGGTGRRPSSDEADPQRAVLTAQDLEASLLREGGEEGAEPGGTGDASLAKKAPEEKENSGRLLLMLLKGSRLNSSCENGEGATGALPENLNDDRWHKTRWQPLLQPFADVNDPKRFANAELFAPGKGSCVSGSGTQPCVLKDVTERDLLVMYKPSGWATCSTPKWEGVEGNLIRYVWARHKDFQQPGGVAPAPCHRLDRGTSGVVAVARSRNALRHIAMQIADRKMVKQYFGLCRGKVDPPQGALSIPLALSNTDKPLGACGNTGRPAVTRYRVLGYFTHPKANGGGGGEYSLLQVQIDHGRQHQIRLHLASLGHPLVSDAKYSAACLKEDARVTSRLFLHAAYLRGTMPPSGDEPLCVACRLPPQLQRCLVTTLQRDRTAELSLSAEAVGLCDCLLQPDPPESVPATPAGANEAEEAPEDVDKQAARQRKNFLRNFDFSQEERDEVIAALERLPSAEQQNSLLLGLREYEKREKNTVVAELKQQVEKRLLEARKTVEASKATGSASPETGDCEDDDLPESVDSEENDEEEMVEEQDVEGVAPVAESSDAGGFGPVRLHSKFVKCKVCGAQEKVDTVEFPELQIQLTCRTSVEPASEQLMRMLNAGKLPPWKGGDGHFSRHRGSHWPTGEGYWDSWRGWENDSPSMVKAKSGAGGGGASSASTASTAANSGSSEVDQRRTQIEREMRQELYAHLQEKGCKNIPGPPVAGVFAIRYNQFLRTDKKRNDGQVRKWIGAQPGVTVEKVGTANQWCVHFEPAHAVMEDSASSNRQHRRGCPPSEAAGKREDSDKKEQRRSAEKQSVWKVKVRD